MKMEMRVHKNEVSGEEGARNEESGTDSETVFKEALTYIVMRLRDRGGKKVARRVQERKKVARIPSL